MAEDATSTLSLDLPDKDEIVTIRVVREPTHGTISVSGDGMLEFTPEADFNGLVTIDYETCWADGHCDQGSVTIVVTPVNDVAGLEVSLATDPLAEVDDPFLAELRRRRERHQVGDRGLGRARVACEHLDERLVETPGLEELDGREADALFEDRASSGGH